MWELWGGQDVRPRDTDITIPIATLEKSVSLARDWYERGFRLLKMKVGKDVDQDIRRLEAVHRALPGISFIGDGNQGFSREDCLTFVRGVQRFGGRIALLEQPVVREDLLQRVERAGADVAEDHAQRAQPASAVGRGRTGDAGSLIADPEASSDSSVWSCCATSIDYILSRIVDMPDSRA